MAITSLLHERKVRTYAFISCQVICTYIFIPNYKHQSISRIVHGMEVSKKFKIDMKKFENFTNVARFKIHSKYKYIYIIKRESNKI